MVPGSNARELLPLLDQRGGEEGAVTGTWKERLCGEHHLTGAAFQLQGKPAKLGSSHRRVRERNNPVILFSLSHFL